MAGNLHEKDSPRVASVGCRVALHKAMLTRRAELLTCWMCLLLIGACQGTGSAPVPEPSAADAPKTAPQQSAVAAPEQVQHDPTAEAPSVAPEEGVESAGSSYEKALAAERRGSLERAAVLYERACGQQQGAACHRLGLVYRDGRGRAVDEGRAAELFAQGCAYGSHAACDAAGH